MPRTCTSGFMDAAKHTCSGEPCAQHAPRGRHPPSKSYSTHGSAHSTFGPHLKAICHYTFEGEFWSHTFEGEFWRGVRTRMNIMWPFMPHRSTTRERREGAGVGMFQPKCIQKFFMGGRVVKFLQTLEDR